MSTLKPKYYVGLTRQSWNKRDVFRALEANEQTHGKYYAAVIGPFRTKRAAEFMRDHGYDNPHCRSVADAERIVKTLAAQSEACAQRIEYLNKQIYA